MTTVVAAFAAFVLVIGLIGIMAVQRAAPQMQSVYNDRVIPLTHLFEVSNRMQEEHPRPLQGGNRQGAPESRSAIRPGIVADNPDDHEDLGRSPPRHSLRR